MDKKASKKIETRPAPNLDFYLGDNLVTIFTRHGWRPLKTAIIMNLVVIFVDVTVAILSGRLLPGKGFRGLFVDLYWWSTIVINVPVIWGYYVWLYKSPLEVMRKLEVAGVIPLKNKEFQDVVIDLNNKRFAHLAIVLAVISGALVYYQGLLFETLWYNPNKFLLFLHSLGWMPTFYASFIIIIRLFFNASVFNKLLKDVVIHPLHPDKAGGLNPLGRYALATTYPLALIGTVFMFTEYWVFIKGEFLLAYASHAMVIFYFIFAPLVFIAPLWAAHDSMLKAKESAILNISSQFNNDLILTYKEISSNSKRLKDNIEKIEQLKKLHDLTTSFPVWPFDTETVRRFLLTMFSPLSGVIVPAIIQYFLNYFLVH